VDAPLGVEIDQEARTLNVSRSDYIARIVADRAARGRVRNQIERDQKRIVPTK
jgi:hypothetical protein